MTDIQPDTDLPAEGITAEEWDAIKGAVPRVIVDYAGGPAQRRTIAARTSGLRKIAAAAQAEASALTAIAISQRLTGEQGQIAEMAAQRRGLQDRIRGLEGELEATRRRLLSATALPAHAVHSSD